MGIGYVSGIACPPFKANEFREEKRKLLADFDITLTESETETFNTLTSPRQIEKFIKEIIHNRLG